MVILQKLGLILLRVVFDLIQLASPHFVEPHQIMQRLELLGVNLYQLVIPLTR
jgi:hypothetical protein